MTSFKLKKIAISILALSSLLASGATMAQCVATAGNASVGSNVTVTATLHTSDPNENGEGEPMSMSSSDGSLSNVIVASYEVPYSFTFISKTNGVSVNGTISGIDGDESCELNINTKRFSDATKNTLTNIINGLLLTSGGLWTADGACTAAIITAPICTLPLSLAAGSTATVAALAGIVLSFDPVDPNYNQIFTAIPATYVPILNKPGLTITQIKAFNALMMNETVIMGQLKAMIVTINRASTAEAAGDTVWSARQLQALAGLNLDLSASLAKEATLRTDAAALFGAAANFTLTPAQVLSFEQSIIGIWSPAQLAVFTSFGIDAATIEKARKMNLVQNINTVANSVQNAFAPVGLIDLIKKGSAASAGVNVTLDNEDINFNSEQILKLEITSTVEFDTKTVDLSSLRFGPNAAVQAKVASFGKADKNGLTELKLFFRAKDTGLTCNSKSADLTGHLSNGNIFSGRISIHQERCKK